MRKSLLVAGLIVLAFLGIADSWYLAEASYTNTPLTCNLAGELSGCNIVAQSPYGHLFGIPLGTYGMVFYGGLFILAAIYAVRPHRWLAHLLGLAGTAGIIASAIFVSIQAFFIKALCIYCLGSAALDVFIFLDVLVLWSGTRPRDAILTA